MLVEGLFWLLKGRRSHVSFESKTRLSLYIWEFTCLYDNIRVFTFLYYNIWEFTCLLVRKGKTLRKALRLAADSIAVSSRTVRMSSLPKSRSFASG